MEANTRKLERLFDQTITYQVPLFQRPYVWTRVANWEPLWDDIQALLDKHLCTGKLHAHFLGAVVLEQLAHAAGSIESRQVIDGQQRFTTLQLFLIAARDVAALHCNSKYVERFQDLVANRPNRIDHADEVYKVWPTNSNRAAYRLVHGAKSLDKLEQTLAIRTDLNHDTNNIVGAYRYFHGQLQSWVAGLLDDDADKVVLADCSLDQRFDSLWHVVKDGLQLVVIDLDKNDETQVIFETLNARGEDLLPADLIKNFLFRRASLAGDDVEELYELHWHQFENAWWREEVKQGRITRPRVDVFMSHYLTMMTREEVKTSHLFNAFKAFVIDAGASSGTLLVGPTTAAQHIAQLSRYAAVFKDFTSATQRPRLATFLRRLEAIDTTTVYPFLLYSHAQLVPANAAEFDKILVLVESYLMRRMICGLTGKNYNRYFVDLIRSVDSAGIVSAAAVAEHMAKSDAESSRYPDDAALLAAIMDLPLYGRLAQYKTRAILEALNEAAHDPKTGRIALPAGLTIEHVMPQSWQAHWPLSQVDTHDPSTGEPDALRLQNAHKRRDRLVNMLGNLTLITGSLNPSLSNNGWEQKRPELLKFAQVNLTRYFHEDCAAAWNELAIDKRTAVLSQHLTGIWPALST